MGAAFGPRALGLSKSSHAIGTIKISQRVHIYNHWGIGTHNSFYSMVFGGPNSLIVVYVDPLGMCPS